MKIKLVVFVSFLASLCFNSYAQEYEVEIEEDRQANRLFLNAVNKNRVDLDVSIVVEGTGFRQRKGVPRKVRVPATSKVNLISLIVERGKEPKYTYTLDISDQLSQRVIKRPATPIKIEPKKEITIYMPENCTNCGAIVDSLETTVFKYTAIKVSENESAQKFLERTFKSSARSLESIDTAIIKLDYSLHLNIADFNELMAKVEEEEK